MPVTFSANKTIEPARTVKSYQWVGCVISLPLDEEVAGGDVAQVTHKYKGLDADGKHVPGSDREGTRTVAAIQAVRAAEFGKAYSAIKTDAYSADALEAAQIPTDGTVS
ncbi:MAG: hypothetical protein Q8R28_02945 [Dehalococcoidia bacterium]|nr:hypothetical protein [Dehalococcoidia bacterium]